MKPKKIPVKQGALLKRFRRKGIKLRKHQGAYYLVSEKGAVRIELETYGRRSGVLKDWERLQ